MADMEQNDQHIIPTKVARLDDQKDDEEPHTKTTDVTQNSEYTDIILIVEDRRLYANKAVLAMVSPVWRAMFKPEYKEAGAEEIPLPGKKFEDMVEFLSCIMPGLQKPVTESNVSMILPLANEYQTEKLKEECESCLVQLLVDKATTLNFELKCLLLAQQYILKTLLQHVVKKLSERPTDVLKGHSDYQSIEAETLLNIIQERSLKLEASQQRMVGHMALIKQKVVNIGDIINNANYIDRCDTHSPSYYYGTCQNCMATMISRIRERIDFLLNKNYNANSGIQWPEG